MESGQDPQDIGDDWTQDVGSDCVVGLAIKQKKKRYLNSASNRVVDDEQRTYALHIYRMPPFLLG